jgi:preprotein translocase subunit SecF
VLAFFIFGGPVLANFSIALLIGIIVGTYSSIYVAGTVLSEWYSKKPQN